MDGTHLSRQRVRWRVRHPPAIPEIDRFVRHRQGAEFTFGYLHPEGHCIHTPSCSPPGSKPFGGNDDGSRCRPQPKQAIAHASVADILFYGGAVGGGKSEYAIVEAITLCLQYPGSKVAIFRRTLTQLEQELEGRIVLLSLADDKNFKAPNGKLFCKYNRQRHVFKFWQGSELHLCFCNHERDVYKYQSFQIIGLFIDESSHFTEFMVKYLCTRVRSAKRGVPKVIRLTSNPGNVGHGWHKRWFIRPVSEELGHRPLPAPFEIWRPLPMRTDRTAPERILTRQFIPAWFHDNFALQSADPDYLGKVYALGGDKALQLAEGDWDANESMICGPFWRDRMLITTTDTLLLKAGLRPDQVIPWHVVNDHRWRPPVGSRIYGSVDYGFGAPWSFHLHATLPGGHTRTFFEFYKAGVRDIDQAARVWRALTTETYRDGKTPLLAGLEFIVYEPMMSGSRLENGIAKSILEVYQDGCQQKVQFLQGAGGRAARMSRPNRWMDALSVAPDGFPHWSCTTACPDLIRTVPEVPWEEVDGHRGEVEDEKSENHCLAEGTLVETRDGPLPIEQIIAGDEVLTRQGYRVVEHAWQTSPSRALYEIETDSAHRLSATGNHRIWTENKGFIRVDQLAYEDILLTDEGVRTACRNRQKRPSSSRPRFRSGEGFVTTCATATSRVGAMVASIVASGLTSTARCLQAFTSIIEMTIARTITPTTFYESPVANTLLITAASRPHASGRRVARISAWLKPHGWLCLPPFQSFVLSVQPDSTLSGKARNSTAPQGAAVTRVRSVRPAGHGAVYDLSVRDVHEFVANGLLVSNSYEDVGRFFEARPHSPRVPPPDPLSHLDDDPISKAHQQMLAKRESPAPKVFDISGLVK